MSLSPNVWPVQIDRAQFEAVIANLATNARDAMPRGGALLIDTRNGRLDEAYAAAHTDVTPGDYVVVEVSDSGTGMPSEVLLRIFEPFFTTKEQGKGTGLGLSMVFGFMKQSGGHITVYSEAGQRARRSGCICRACRHCSPRRRNGRSNRRHWAAARRSWWWRTMPVCAASWCGN